MEVERERANQLVVKLSNKVPVTLHREQSVKREKTNKMQQSDV